MGSTITDFRLSFCVAARESGEVVCYKQDGTRFDQVQTVKLNANTEYEMRFTLQPPLHVDLLMTFISLPEIFRKYLNKKHIRDTILILMRNNVDSTSIAYRKNKLMINGDLHKLELLKTSQDMSTDTRTYRTLYETTGYDITKRKKRKELLLVLELQNGVYMKFSLQCKVYKPGETDHAHWGQKLSAIHMECKMEPGHNYVTIDREKYL